jgi:menaquinone reductase, multiheme cytochrome c subunit
MAEVLVKYRRLISLGIGLAAGLALGWVAFPRALYRQAEQPVQFSHKTHTGDAVGMSCEDCHSFSDNGRFAGIPKLESCAGCHSEAQGTTAAEKHFVEEYVAKEREVEWLVYSRQPDNVYFSHAPHVKLAELTCEQCHGPHGSSETLRPYQENRLSGYSRDIWGSSISRVRNAEWEGAKMTDCSGCHRKRGVQESCLTCHK